MSYTRGFTRRDALGREVRIPIFTLEVMPLRKRTKRGKKKGPAKIFLFEKAAQSRTGRT